MPLSLILEPRIFLPEQIALHAQAIDELAGFGVRGLVVDRCGLLGWHGAEWYRQVRAASDLRTLQDNGGLKSSQSLWLLSRRAQVSRQ